MKKMLGREINNAFVVDVMDKLCVSSMNDSVNAADRINGLDMVIIILKKFEDFENQKESLLVIKKKWEQASSQCKPPNRRVINFCAALNSLIHAHSKDNDILPLFQEAIRLVLDILEEQKVTLVGRTNLKSSDTATSHKRGYSAAFFPRENINDTNAAGSSEKAKRFKPAVTDEKLTFGT